MTLRKVLGLCARILRFVGREIAATIRTGALTVAAAPSQGRGGGRSSASTVVAILTAIDHQSREHDRPGRD